MMYDILMWISCIVELTVDFFGVKLLPMSQVQFVTYLLGI